MDFELDRPQKHIKKAVKDFVKGKFKKEIVQELTETQKFPAALLRDAAELGFIGINFPEEYEGEGLSVFEKALIAEDLCHGDASVGSCLVWASSGAEIILNQGSDEQKRYWLPKIADGSILPCRAYTEGGIGHDFSRIKTTAEKNGDQWTISGQKNYVINAGPMSGYYAVLCRTENGLSTILVEADRKGIEIKDVGKRISARMMFMGSVNFEAVRVPSKNLIGKEGNGFNQALTDMDQAAAVSAAQAVGIAQGAFERAFSHVKQREQFSKKLIDFQTTQQKIADMATQIAAARLMTYKAASSFHKGKGDRRLCAMAKHFAARAAVGVCDEAIQLLGGYGYIEEYEVERFYRAAKINDILQGTKIYQKQVIAKTLMKRSA